MPRSICIYYKDALQHAIAIAQGAAFDDAVGGFFDIATQAGTRHICNLHIRNFHMTVVTCRQSQQQQRCGYNRTMCTFALRQCSRPSEVQACTTEVHGMEVQELQMDRKGHGYFVAANVRLQPHSIHIARSKGR